MIGRDLVVDLGPRRYPVHIRRGARPELVERIAAFAAGGRAIVISDDTVARLHAAPVVDALEARGLDAALLTFTPGEENKTLATVERLYAAALDAGVDRHTPIIAFGGGVVGDVAGFVAATLLRGLPYAQVPTTVLAQVDSSVGGKTGVDLPRGKNLVGAFHQPEWVFVDVEHLETLPAREIRAGLAEAIKHAALADPTMLDRITDRGYALSVGDLDALGEVIGQAIAIKADVVADDELEAGKRAILNFGHTLGHALEAATGYTELRHGEAVALGMRFAARLSVAKIGLDPDAVLRLDAALDACHLPDDWARRIDDAVLSKVASDKKIHGQSIRTILLAALGEPRIVPLPISTFVHDARSLAQSWTEEDRR